jgi:hypothetical protein
MTTTAVTSGRLINDLGPSEFGGAESTEAISTARAAQGPSVADIAAKFKARQGTQNARTITNADVERMLGSNTNSGTATVASNMPPSALPQSSQAATAGSTTQQSNSSQSNTSTAQSSAAPAQSNAGSAQTQATNSAASQTSAQPENSQADTTASNNAGTSATTPQINQGKAQGEQSGNRLPATSTILPLLGLLGLASGGVGLWYRKSRK